MANARSASGWQRWGFRILVAIIVLGLITSTLAIWANVRIQDTDAWTETMAPLATDPDIQAFIVSETTSRIDEQLKLDESAGRLRTATRNQIAPLVGMLLEEFVSSPTFAEWWSDANRLAHETLVYAASIDNANLKVDKNGNLVLNLEAVIAWTNTRINEIFPGSGYTLTLAPDETELVLYSSDAVETIVHVLDLIDTLALVLPVVTVVAFIGALLLAQDRLGAVGRIGLATAISIGILLVIVAIAKSWIVDSQPENRQDVLAAVLRILLVDLRGAFRTAIAVGVVVAGVVALWQSNHIHGESMMAWLGRYRIVLAAAALGLGALYLAIASDPAAWAAICALAVIAASGIALLMWRKSPANPVG
ncbi:MAG: hypothetical protein KC435_04535 [Thermomicrobiales bacterium]|nr:hypothetical protein [Thermomicrobiales bacterium]